MKRKRVLVGALVALVVAAVLTVDTYFVRGLPFATLLSVVAFAASYELCIILKSSGFATYPKLTAFASFVVAILPAWAHKFASGTSSFAIQAGAVFLFMVIAFGVALREEDKRSGALAVIAGTFVLVYVGFALSFFVRLRSLPEVGTALMLFAVGCAKVGDIGAYFAGHAFGRHPLAPRVSPKKTVEGAIGGLAASLAMAFLVAPFVKGRIELPVLLVWAGTLAVAAQYGDLAESLLKRSGEVKDSSGFFGGMGGVLDVVDSLLLCAPTAYILALWRGLGGG